MEGIDKKEQPEWTRLKKVAKRVDYGKIEIVIQNGRPVRVEGGIKQIKLDNPDDFEDGMSVIPL